MPSGTPWKYVRGRDGARLRADILADDNDREPTSTTPDEASDLRAITSSSSVRPYGADRVPRRPYDGSVRRLRIHRGLGVRLAFLRGNRLCVLPHVRRDVRPVLHGGGARAGADGGADAGVRRALGAAGPAPSAPTALPTFGARASSRSSSRARSHGVASVYVELSADLGRFESIMLTLGDGAALVRVGRWTTAERGSSCHADGRGLVRRTARAGPLGGLVFDEGFDFCPHVAAVDISTETSSRLATEPAYSTNGRRRARRSSSLAS